MKRKWMVLLLALAMICAAGCSAVCVSADTATAAPERAAPAETVDISKEKTDGGQDNNASAQKSARETDSVRAVVNGAGEVTVNADAAQLSFRIRILSDSFTEGKKALSEKKTALFDAMRKITETTGENQSYEMSRPLTDGEYGAIEFTATVYAKIRDISKAAEVKNAAVATGATHLFTLYLLEDDSEAMRSALALAKEDAESKASALLGGTPKLVKLLEQHCGWHCPAEEEGKVTVHAEIRACFTL